MILLDPQPGPEELPARLASPFAAAAPHALALRAALDLQDRLRRLALPELELPRGGKMFGVLVVAAADGAIGFLQAFSGMLQGRWQVEGFSPPLFNPAALDAFWPAAELELRALEEGLKPNRSRQLLRRIRELYQVPSARGETRSLASMFADMEPPGGAGDCAAPKLFAEAFARRLKPLALAEFWWGAPSPGGERQPGSFHPSCREKCGAVLPFMLEGLEVEAAPALPEQELRIVFEDPSLLVVDRPAGMPAVPGRHEPLRDSVLVRLRLRESGGGELFPLQRPETEASGLMLVAKSEVVLAALQRQLARGEAECRHAAWLEGELTGGSGVVEVPLSGKAARTEWSVVERRKGWTRVTLIPRTDRSHQLPLHCTALSAAIVSEAERLLLHADALSFRHPVSDAPMAFESPAPF